MIRNSWGLIFAYPSTQNCVRFVHLLGSGSPLHTSSVVVVVETLVVVVVGTIVVVVLVRLVVVVQ